MKALTLTQPWASLMAMGAKRIETRSWFTLYRGPVAIHAARGFPAWAKDLCSDDRFCEALGWEKLRLALDPDWYKEVRRRADSLPRGCILATGTLVGCLQADLVPHYVKPFTEQERAFGDYSMGRYAWLFDDVKPLAEPVPAYGALGLWEWKGVISGETKPLVPELKVVQRHPPFCGCRICTPPAVVKAFREAQGAGKV